MIPGARYGFITPCGELMIPMKFEDAAGFNEGFGCVKVKNHGYGIIDFHGNLFIDPIFDQVYLPDGGGIFAARTKEGWGYFDLYSKKWLIPPSFANAYSFESGRAFVAVKKNERRLFGLIDRTGHFIVEPTWDTVSLTSFSDGFPEARIGQQTFFVDRDGKHVLGPYSWVLSPFIEGVAYVGSDAFTGLIDIAGNRLLEAKDWGGRGWFENGVIPVETQEGFGIMDLSGTIKTVPGCTAVGRFQNGFASCTIDGKVGIVDTFGNLCVEPVFDEAYGWMSSGLMPVRKNEEWGYIDKQGNVLIEFEFLSAEPFWNGLAAVAAKDE